MHVGEGVKNAVGHKKPCSFCARLTPLTGSCPARIIRKVVILAGQRLVGGVRWAPIISGFEDLAVVEFYLKAQLNLKFTTLFPFYCFFFFFFLAERKACLLEKLFFSIAMFCSE